MTMPPVTLALGLNILCLSLEMELRRENFQVCPHFCRNIFLFSCASHTEKYPPNWPKLIEDSSLSCPNLDGTYSNSEIDTSNSHYSSPSKLAPILIDSDSNELYKIINTTNEVEITGMSPEKLQIRLLENGKDIYKTLIEKDHDFYCSSTFLILKDMHSTPSPMKAHTKFNTTKLAKAADGSLVVNFTTREFGLSLFIVPYTEDWSSWVRFLPSKISK